MDIAIKISIACFFGYCLAFCLMCYWAHQLKRVIEEVDPDLRTNIADLFVDDNGRLPLFMAPRGLRRFREIYFSDTHSDVVIVARLRRRFRIFSTANIILLAAFIFIPLLTALTLAIVGNAH